MALVAPRLCQVTKTIGNRQLQLHQFTNSWPKRCTGSAFPSGDFPAPPRPSKYLRPQYQSPGKDLASRMLKEIGIYCHLQLFQQSQVPSPDQPRGVLPRGELSVLSRHSPFIPVHNTLLLCCVLVVGRLISPGKYDCRTKREPNT